MLVGLPEVSFLKLAVFTSLGFLAVLVALTWWVLESSEVAVVVTHPNSGEARSTHVWHVLDGGELWLEAGSPSNGWYGDVVGDPELTLVLDAAPPQGFRAEPVFEVAAQRRVRSLIRRKYGFRDIWIGFFVDHSEAVAVRLIPSSADPGSTPGPSSP